MSNLVEQKKKFLMLLLQTRKMLSQKKRIQGWDYVIDKYAEISPEKLEEKFRFNTLYLLEKIIEPELDSFRLDKINKKIDPKIKVVLKDMDRILTDQMSSILAKVYVANLLLTNKKVYIDELHEFIVQRNYNNCILHDLIREY
jgi:hypothetical protein